MQVPQREKQSALRAQVEIEKVGERGIVMWKKCPHLSWVLNYLGKRRGRRNGTYSGPEARRLWYCQSVSRQGSSGQRGCGREQGVGDELDMWSGGKEVWKRTLMFPLWALGWKEVPFTEIWKKQLASCIPVVTNIPMYTLLTSALDIWLFWPMKCEQKWHVIPV